MGEHPIGSASSSSREDDQKRPQQGLRIGLRRTSSVSRTVLFYGLVPVLIAIATALSLLLQPFVPNGYVYLFLATVVASAWLGSRGPGLFAVVLASLSLDYFFLPPLHTIGIGWVALPHFIPFLLAALAAAWTSSARKRAQEQVRLQSAALESAASAIVIADTHGTIQWANRAFTQLTGYPLEEAIGQNARILKSGRQDESFYSSLWNTILAGKVWFGEITNRKKGGQLYTEEMTIAPVRSLGGEITNFIAIKQDVTERKRVAASLEQSEEQFRALAENIPEVFFVLSLDPVRTTYMSPAYDTIWGRSRQALYEDPGAWIEAIHQDDQGHVKTLLAHSLKGNSIEMEYRVVRPDSSIRYIHARAFPVLDSEGQLSRIVGLAEDITAQKQAAADLAEARARLDGVFQAATQVAIVATDPAGLITVFNPGAEKMLGYSADEVVGRSTPEIFHLRSELKKRGEELTLKLGRPIEGFRVFVEQMDQDAHEEREWTYVRKDGTSLSATLAVTELRDHRGNVSGFLSIAKDITERKRAEEKLRNSESKHRVLFEDSADAALLMDEKGFVDCNSAALQIFGYATRAELSALRPADLSPPDQPDGTPSEAGSEQKIGAALLNGKNRFEWLHWRKDGQVFPAEVSLTALTLNGRPALLGTVRDISERKRMEDKLRRLAAIVESSDDAIISKALDGTIQTWNGGAERIYGYSAAEAIGRPISIIFSDGQRDEIPALLEKIKPDAIVQHFQTVRAEKGGKQIHIDLTVSPINDDTGRIAGASIIARDITERVKAEERLRLWSRVLDQSAEGIFICDPQERILLVNRAFEQLTGFSADEAVGKTPRILQSGRQDRAFYADMWKSVAGDGDVARRDVESSQERGVVCRVAVNQRCL